MEEEREGERKRKNKKKEKKQQADRTENVCEDGVREQLPPGCAGEKMSSAVV